MTHRDAKNWSLRTVPTQLRERYLAEGLWTDATIGQMVAEGLADKADVAFVIHSKVRPWRGTTGEVHRAARSFATALRARGVGPGDVVVFQLPNSVEAAITFWGAAYVGAVVVPVVHFYGSKELSYIPRQPPRRRQRLRQTHPSVSGGQSRPSERCPPCCHRRRWNRVPSMIIAR